jgi:ankyrin repeat protein
LDFGGDINHCNSEGFTALLSACKEEKIQVAKVLLQRGADVNIVNPITGFTVRLLLSF